MRRAIGRHTSVYRRWTGGVWRCPGDDGDRGLGVYRRETRSLRDTPGPSSPLAAPQGRWRARLSPHGGACSGLRPVWRIAGSAVETEPDLQRFRWGNRGRRERRIGAAAACERRGVPARTGAVVPAGVTAASAAGAARSRPRLHRLPRRPMTAKSAAATRATITMEIATIVTGGGSPGSPSGAGYAKRSAEETDGTGDHGSRRDDRRDACGGGHERDARRPRG